MTDDPSDEPGDQDRTIIRPMPGGSRRAARAAPPPAAAPPEPAPAPAPAPAGPDIETIPASNDPLAIAAAPLLQFLSRLRNTATAPDPGDMLTRTRRELRTFEQRAREQAVPPFQLRLAHYALCAALDDVVLNTPWGSQGRWHDQPLVKALHQDDNGGAGFFDQLRTLRESLPESRPVLELMFICLALGMMGPYRAMPDGRAQVERIRRHVYEMINQSAPAVPALLAPDATGVDARFAPAKGSMPIWVGASVALALTAGLYVWWLSGLNAASDEVYRSALAAPPTAMPALARPPATPPPPPAPPVPGPADRLRAALADMVDIEVIGGASATIVRVPARALFPQANATIGAGPLPERLAQALRPENGAIKVLVYTDSQPERSVAFPSNFALSTARAKAVRTALARTLPDPARITAEGRADADPVVPNSTAEGREKNRRIDILLADAP